MNPYYSSLGNLFGGQYVGPSGTLAGGGRFIASALFDIGIPSGSGDGDQTLWGNEDGSDRGWSIGYNNVAAAAGAGPSPLTIFGRLGTGGGTTTVAAIATLPAPYLFGAIYLVHLYAENDDGTSLSLYVNGTRVNSIVTSDGVASTDAPIVGGRGPAAGITERAGNSTVLGVGYTVPGAGDSFSLHEQLIALHYHSCAQAGFDMRPFLFNAPLVLPPPLVTPGLQDFCYSVRRGLVDPSTPVIGSGVGGGVKVASPTWLPEGLAAPVLTTNNEGLLVAAKGGHPAVFAGAAVAPPQ